MNILFTSVGRRSYLVEYFKSVIGNDGRVLVANSTDITPAFQVADKAVVTPLIFDPSYIDFLLNFCEENGVDVIISLFDIDLPILAKNKKKFQEHGIKVIVSDEAVIDVCNDKWKTYQFLIAHDFEAPKTYISMEDAISAIDAQEISFPVMVKPRWGMGSLGVYEAETKDELVVLYNKTRRKIDKSYLKYESTIDIDRSILIQERINGQEYGLDVINDLNGHYCNTIPKMKYAMRSGETDIAVTVCDKELKKLGKRISESLGHISNLDVDVFKENDKYFILEMNARFGGGYPFSHIAGVNLPLAIIKWLNNERVSEEVLTERVNVMSQKDIRVVRLKKEEIVNIDVIRDADIVFNNLSIMGEYLLPPLSQRKISIMNYTDKLLKNGIVFAAQKKDTIVGIAAAYANDRNSREGYLTFLAVNPGERGCRIGEKLLMRVEKYCKSAGMKRIKLEVRNHNFNAINFYKKYGYKLKRNDNEISYMIKML